MDTAAVAKTIQHRLSALYGERLRQVIVYGSVARGEEREDSDIDLLVVLNGEVRLAQEMARIHGALYALSLGRNHCLSAKPVSAAAFENALAPLYVEAKREGIVA